MRFMLLIPICLATSACELGVSAEEESASFNRLNKAVLAAMCEPWGRERVDSLERLVDAVQTYRSEDGNADAELVGTYAIDVSPKDCVEAGYANPGPAMQFRKPPILRDRPVP